MPRVRTWQKRVGHPFRFICPMLNNSLSFAKKQGGGSFPYPRSLNPSQRKIEGSVDHLRGNPYGKESLPSVWTHLRHPEIV